MGPHEIAIPTPEVLIHSRSDPQHRHGKLGTHQYMGIDYQSGTGKLKELHLGPEGVLLADDLDLTALVLKHLSLLALPFGGGQCC